MQPCDIYVLDDPYHDETHLPDITVVKPVLRIAQVEVASGEVLSIATPGGGGYGD